MQAKTKIPNFLYPYQTAFIEDESQFILWLKSRQIGGSFASAYKAVLGALKGKNYIMISTSLRNARRIIKTCHKAIKIFKLISKQQLALSVDNKDELVFQGGGQILSIANNPDTAVGESGHIIIDEAARFKNSEEILDAVIPFISRGYSMTMLSTPMGKRGMFWEAYQKATQDYSNWSFHKTVIHDAIAQGCPIDINTIKEEMTEESFRQNYLCEYIDDVTSFFSYELILKNISAELHNYSLLDMQKTKGLKYAGYDPGKLVDSGVFTVLIKTPEGHINHVHTKEFKKVPYSEQIAYVVSVMQGAQLSRVFVDATGVGVKIYEDMQRVLGSMVMPITYTNTVKEQLVTDLKIAMERNEISLPDDPHLMDQLHGIEREITPAGNTRYSHASNKHDDIVLSICNALSGFSKKRTFNLDDLFIGKKLKMAEVLNR